MGLPKWAKRAPDGAIEIDTDAAYTLYLGRMKAEPSALNLEIARRCIHADLYDLCVVAGETFDHERFTKAKNEAFVLKSHAWDEAKDGPVDKAAGLLWRSAYAAMPAIAPVQDILDAFEKRYHETGNPTAPKSTRARGAFESWLKAILSAPAA